MLRSRRDYPGEEPDMEQLERLPIVAPIFAAPVPVLLRDAPAPDKALALPALQAAAQPIAVAPRFGTPVARRAVLLAARAFSPTTWLRPSSANPGPGGMPASLASLLAARPQLNLAAANAAAPVINVAATPALTAAAGDGAVADDLAALEAEFKRIRAEAEQAVADKNRVIEAKTTAYNALVDAHSALVATRDQRAAQAQAATNAVQPQLQQLEAELQTLQGQLGTLATAMNGRFIAANAAIEALTAFDKGVQEGTEPDAQELHASTRRPASASTRSGRNSLQLSQAATTRSKGATHTLRKLGRTWISASSGSTAASKTQRPRGIPTSSSPPATTTCWTSAKPRSRPAI
jgi:hypothetical protein